MEKKFGSTWKTSIASSLEAIRHNQNLKPQLAVAFVLVMVVGVVVYSQGGRSGQDQVTVAADTGSESTIEQIVTSVQSASTAGVNPLSQPIETAVDGSTTTSNVESTSSAAAKQKPVGYPPSPKRTQCQSYYGASVANVAFAPETTAEGESTTTKPPTTTAQPTTTKPPTTTAQPTTTKPPTTTAQPTTTKPPTTTAQPTTTKAPATTVAPTTAKSATTNAHPSGWVNAGHNVYVPKVLIVIRCCESTGNYTAANAHSSARGAYQFLTGSWAAYGHKDRYGVSQAHLASPAQQDEAALKTWERDSTRPWNASKACWGQNPV